MLFSQRIGLKPLKAIQSESMDDDLKNSLWNALTIYYWNDFEEMVSLAHYSSGHFITIPTLLTKLWMNFYKITLDTLRSFWYDDYKIIKNRFYEYKWYEVYDFIDFIAQNSGDSTSEKFIKYCNSILEREVSAYRFVGNKIAKITSPQEISEIEEAIQKTDSFRGINAHIRSALDKMSDRKEPDYRNSIKESISAVESLVRLIAAKPNASLGDALKEIESKSGINLHPALRESFNKLYGYTSNADGIRHALMDEPNLSFSDAKYMLVSCSAFINYLLDKATKAGIKIQ